MTLLLFHHLAQIQGILLEIRILQQAIIIFLTDRRSGVRWMRQRYCHRRQADPSRRPHAKRKYDVPYLPDNIIG